MFQYESSDQPLFIEIYAVFYENDMFQSSSHEICTPV